MVADARLYDSTGTLIPIPAPPPMRATIVPDGVESNVHDRYREYPSKGLTPRRIETILEQADQGEPLELIQLCEEMVEKDPKIGSVLHTRTAAIMGLPHEVRAVKLEDGTQEEQDMASTIAEFCDDALDRAGVDDLIGDLMDSVFKPLAVDWIQWGLDEFRRTVPEKFTRIPPTHLRWGRTSDTIRMWDPYQPFVTDNEGEIGTTFGPYTTVRALNNERRDHPTRAGLGRSAAWYYLFKNTSIKDWISHADRFGTPLRILKMTPEDFNNPAKYEAARAALKSIGAAASGVISNEWQLDLMQAVAAKSSVELFQLMIDYVDKAIGQLVLGHELSSQSSPGSGQLGITAALQVRQDILEGDCNFLACVIRRDLLTPMVGWNFGWENVRFTPYFVFDFQPPKDLVAQANVTATIAKTFTEFPFSEQQLRDEYGFDIPADDADTVRAGAGKAAVAAPSVPDIPAGIPITMPMPEITVNAVASTNSRTKKRGRTVSKPTVKKLSAVDRAGMKAANAITAETEKWRMQLRTMIREAAKEGLGLSDLRNRILALWPDLNADAIEKTLHEQMLLVRLFGRNG